MLFASGNCVSPFRRSLPLHACRNRNAPIAAVGLPAPILKSGRQVAKPPFPMMSGNATFAVGFHRTRIRNPEATYWRKCPDLAPR
jgi:hypothetical protein